MSWWIPILSPSLLNPKSGISPLTVLESPASNSIGHLWDLQLVGAHHGPGIWGYAWGMCILYGVIAFVKAWDYYCHVWRTEPAACNWEGKHPVWLSHSAHLEKPTERRMGEMLPWSPEGFESCKMKTAKAFWCPYSSRCICASRFDYRH